MRHLRRWYVYLPVSAILLALVILRTRPWEAAERLSGFDAPLVAAILSLNAALILLWADRSAALLSAVERPLSRLTLVPIVTFANTMNNLTPASTGEALRAMILRERHGIALRRSTPVILMERLYAFYLMGITAGSLALVEAVQKPQFVVAAFGILAILTFAPNLAYEFLHIRPVALMGRGLGRLLKGPTAQRLSQALVEVDEHVNTLMTHPAEAFGFVARTAVIFAVFAVQLSLILAGLGAPLPPWTTWAALGLAMVAGILSALPFGLGATDSVLAVLLVAAGVPVEVAGLSAFMLRLLQTAPMGLLGTLAYVYLSRTMSRPTDPWPRGADRQQRIDRPRSSYQPEPSDRTDSTV